VVHTCGIGTLAQALRSGRPQLIVPAAFDQFDNAARAGRLGVGRVLPFQHVTADRLATELQRLLSTRAYERAASDVRAAVANEDGAAAACDAMERLVAS
jgi:rhamnosyltransferase subunit B